ncbi:MAG: hypothetical protein QF471_08310 [Phycisphaerales bacterium]|jgi:hypothetical protein|nr:hypothetical protein [Phycisphaerales bacterium]
MPRETGQYRITSTHDEEVHAFTPHRLPPANPPLSIDGQTTALHEAALYAARRLAIAAALYLARQLYEQALDAAWNVLQASVQLAVDVLAAQLQSCCIETELKMVDY